MIKFEDVEVGDGLILTAGGYEDISHIILFKGYRTLFVRNIKTGSEFTLSLQDLKYYTKKQEPVVSEINLFRIPVGKYQGKLSSDWVNGKKAFTLKITEPGTEPGTETTCELIPHNPSP